MTSALCTMLHHYQNNGQVEAYIKPVKCTIDECTDANQDTNLAL